jgi:aromatic ring-cleaving dioxygenase
VHWITGAELREIYADDLSLDKYDEIRKRSVPAYEAMLAESLTEDRVRTLLMWLARNRKELFSQIVCPACKEDVAEKAAAEARHAAIYEILTDLKFACPGGEPTPICDLCGANRYCIELRSKEQKP